MTQDNILVSPTLSACLKPGVHSLRSRHSVSGDTLELSPADPFCTAAPPGISSFILYNSSFPQRPGDTHLISADLPRLASLLIKVGLIVANEPLPFSSPFRAQGSVGFFLGKNTRIYTKTQVRCVCFVFIRVHSWLPSALSVRLPLCSLCHSGMSFSAVTH